MSTDNIEINQDFEHQWKIISRGAVDLLPEDEFKEKVKRSIKENKPLRIKQGFDPTAPDIHLGHTVGIRKLKQFQDLGHKIVLIVGDYTALVGDPSGRSDTRPMLSYDQIMKNAETYQKQFFKILDKSKCEIHFNGDWFKKMDFREFIGLTTKFTVARLLERDDFSNRFKNGIPISVHELFYPLMQAYDSVAIKADVELGATEQKFNLLAGRTIQEAFDMAPQCVLTLPILVGLDGDRRMSKTLGNYVGIDESAEEMFGKVMSIPDTLIYHYFELATDVTLEELAAIKEQLERTDVNPMDIKKQLGEVIVEMYHPAGSGKTAREKFELQFSQKQVPDDIPEIDLEHLKKIGLDPKAVYLVHLMTRTKLVSSGGEARRLIKGGGVSLDGDRVTDPNCEFAVEKDVVLKVGKLRYLRIRAS